MKKILTFAVTAILLSSASSAFAFQSTSVPVNCIDDATNHGAYVSCIAREHLGGAVTSEAAKSDIGKKDIAPTTIPTPIITLTPTLTPTPVVTATPIVSPTTTPTETITPTVTPTGTEEASIDEQEALSNELKGLLGQLKNFIKSLISFPQLN